MTPDPNDADRASNSEPGDPASQPGPAGPFNSSNPFGETRPTGGQRPTPAGDPLRTSTGRPAASDALAAIGQRLIELSIIDERQWNEALARAGTISDLEAVLEALRRMPSLRRHRLEPNLPALTAYQANAIREQKMESLRLGPYLFIDQVGAGGMGEVFKAWNLNLDRIEAIKLVTHADVTGSTVGMARFDREARVLAQLHHPCITTIYNTGREQGSAFIAMEFVQGKTLLDIVREAKKKGDKVPEAWAIEAMREVASALGHAHEMGIIHRDIKPNNIMITSSGDVRLLDLGIARLLDPTTQQAGPNLTRQVAGLGTPEVMPPEQWADASSVSPASDIYSLGCTLFYLLAGQMPFSGDSLHGLMSAHLINPAPSLRSIRPEISQKTDSIVQKMLAKEPRDRFASCEELLRAFDATTIRETPTAPARPAKGQPTVWILLASLLLVAGLTAGTAYYLVNLPNYGAIRQGWLTEFQQANIGTWPTMQPLLATLQKENAPRVDSQATLEEFKTWVQARTEVQTRYRHEFYTWAQSWQEQKRKIWRTPDQLLDYFKADLATVTCREDIDVVRQMVEDETARREALRAKARLLLTSAQRENSQVFSSPAEIESITGQSLAIDDINNEQDLERFRQALEKAVQQRRKGKSDPRRTTPLNPFVDAPKNAEKTREQLGKTGKGEMPAPPGRIDPARRDQVVESWQRQATQWLDEYPTNHAVVWSSPDDLTHFVEQAFPTEVTDESSLNRLREVVRQETRRRLDPIFRRWRSDLAAKFPSVLPTSLEISFSPEVEETFAGPNGQEKFEVALLRDIRQRLQNPRIAKSDQPALDFQHDHLLRLLVLLAGMAEPAGTLTARMELAGQPIDVVPLETRATLTLESSLPGYVTVMVLESSGRLFAFQWDEPIPAHQKINVVRFDSASAGEDRIVCFVTENNPRHLLPLPPAEWNIKPVGVPEGFLTKFILPPILPEKEEMGRLREAFPTPAVWDELCQALAGSPPSYLSTSPELGKWGKTSLTVRWGVTK